MNTLPQFYAQPVPFNMAVHGQLQFAEMVPEFGFAAKADVIALQVSEVAQAVRHYPLVFLPGTGEAPFMLAVLVGLGDGVNRYVDDKGAWRAQTYIPAYVRRYPFLPMQIAGQTDPILAIDTTQDWVQAQAGDFLVDSEGRATPRLQRVMAFQQEYQKQADITQVMCAALHAAGILVPRTLTWQGVDAETRQLDGFWCVEEAKLKALSPEALQALHQADALGLAYAQLLSMNNLQGLIATPGPVSAHGNEQKISRAKKTARNRK
jgi:hypothetical protein